VVGWPCNDRVKSFGCRGGCSPACAKLLAINWSSAAREQRELSRIGDQAGTFVGLAGHRARTGPYAEATSDTWIQGSTDTRPGPGHEPTRTVELAQVQTREV